MQYKSAVVPVEVKAEENLRSKSLASIIKSNPELTGLRLSMSDFRRQDWLVNIPLLAAGVALEAVSSSTIKKV